MEKINFKTWLALNGVDIKLFEENIQPINQKWNVEDKVHTLSREGYNWVTLAFLWDKSLQKLTHSQWTEISYKWRNLMQKTPPSQIEFGFDNHPFTFV